ncbi:MAG: nitroreductase family protein [Eubacteriales bacterium]|nr:nitroreductase family protein [Eubacteriales bacterium]
MEDFVIIDRGKCIGCGSCVSDCISKIISLEERVAVIKDFTNCIKCGHCGAVCPVNAISYQHTGYDVGVDEFEKDIWKIEFNQLDALIKMKRSCRQFKKKPIEKSKMDAIMRIGQMSPTGGNRQPLKFVVVDSPDKMEALKLMAMKTLYSVGQNTEGRYGMVFRSILDNYESTGFDRLFYNAPCVIIIYGDPKSSHTTHVDAGIAGGQMTLIAETLGLGSCFVGYLKTATQNNNEIYRFLGIPEGHEMIANIILGYPDVRYFRSVPRQKLDVKFC